MNKARTFAWILGWAIPPSWFKTLVDKEYPLDDHTFIDASQNTLKDLSLKAPFDFIVGYSLGSLILLKEASRVKSHKSQVILLAPILGFLLEENLGGKIERSELKYTKRMLKQGWMNTVESFYTRSQLLISAKYLESLNPDTLAWGLSELESVVIRHKVPESWSCFCGAQDSLLDAAILKSKIPRLTVVQHATHAPELLLKALKESLV